MATKIPSKNEAKITKFLQGFEVFYDRLCFNYRWAANIDTHPEFEDTPLYAAVKRALQMEINQEVVIDSPNTYDEFDYQPSFLIADIQLAYNLIQQTYHDEIFDGRVGDFDLDGTEIWKRALSTIYKAYLRLQLDCQIAGAYGESSSDLTSYDKGTLWEKNGLQFHNFNKPMPMFAANDLAAISTYSFKNIPSVNGVVVSDPVDIANIAISDTSGRQPVTRKTIGVKKLVDGVLAMNLLLLKGNYKPTQWMLGSRGSKHRNKETFRYTDPKIIGKAVAAIIRSKALAVEDIADDTPISVKLVKKVRKQESGLFISQAIALESLVREAFSGQVYDKTDLFGALKLLVAE